MDNSVPGFSVLHYLPEFSHIHVQWVSDAIQPFHLLLSLLLLLSTFPRITDFSNGSGLHIKWSKYWSLSFSISPSSEYSGLISLGLTDLIFLLSKWLSRIFSSTIIWKHQFFSDPLLSGPTFTFIRDYCKNHRFEYTNLCWQSDVSAFGYAV